jgi:diamine N-acetyltransferase
MSATIKILEIAFCELELERVYLNVISSNIRAKRFYEKAGFRYEGCFRKHLQLQGDWFDWDWYAVLKDEYYAGDD